MAKTSAIFKGAFTKLLTNLGLKLETGQKLQFEALGRIETEDQTAAATNSGTIRIDTGDASGAGSNTGGIIINGGTADESTGAVELKSGDSTNLNTGAVTVKSGDALAGTTTGALVLETGDGLTGSGNINISTGDSGAGSGILTLDTGSAVGTKGDIRIKGLNTPQTGSVLYSADANGSARWQADKSNHVNYLAELFSHRADQDVAGWTPTANCAVSRETGADNIDGVASFGFSATASATTGDYIQSDTYTIREIDKGLVNALTFFVKSDSSYTNGDFEIVIIEDPDGAPSEIVPSVTAIDANDTSVSKFEATWSPTTEYEYAVRIKVATASTAFEIFVSRFDVGSSVVGTTATRNRVQKKHLASDITDTTGAGGNIAALAFSGLTTGRLYKYTGVIWAQLDGADTQLAVDITHNSASIGRVIAKDNDTSFDTIASMAFDIIFTAAAATVQLDVDPISTGFFIDAVSGGVQSTWTQLEELNNYDITDDFGTGVL